MLHSALALLAARTFHGEEIRGSMMFLWEGSTLAQVSDPVPLSVMTFQLQCQITNTAMPSADSANYIGHSQRI